MKENVLQRMERTGAKEHMAAFQKKMQMPYEFKVKYAQRRAEEFAEECGRRGLNYHVSVGGLDSITLLLFLRALGINAPGISVSFLEDISIQRVHKQLGVECLLPLKRADGTFWTKAKVIQEFGFPVLSKEIAANIEFLENPTEQNKHNRHAIITGERNGVKSTIMSKRWLSLFGGCDPEGASLGYKAAPFRVSNKCCYYLKKRPSEIWAKEHNSVPYLGLMVSEGGGRAKRLIMTGCNYFGESTTRSAPFAIFQRQDILQLALDLDVPVPAIYGTIERKPDGTLYTTKAQRTGCSMCGFGIHMEKRPHRFDLLRERNEKEWEHLMYHLVKDDSGNWYGWGKVLDYIGVEWETPPSEGVPGQINLFEVTK